MTAKAKRPEPKLRLYGEIWLKDKTWHFTGDPHVINHLKRIFPRIWTGQHGTVTFKDTDEMRQNIEWFLFKYRMKVSPEDRRELILGSRRHVETVIRMDELVDLGYVAREFPMELPPRDYQKVAAQMYLELGSLLLADDLGVGKTVSALASLTDPRTLPALVVTLTGTMPNQWREQTWKFLPKLTTHVVKKGTPYPLPRVGGRGPDVVIINYHKLHGWCETLGEYVKSVIFDEVQELRRAESNKYSAAEHVAQAVKFRIGLSATPIFNLGGEMWNVVNVLRPDVLGTWEEFLREWCYGERTDKRAPAVKDPVALGSYLKAEHILLRRTRKDVGRELPALTKTVQTVESDEGAFKDIEDQAAALARIILSQEKMGGFDRMKATEEFDNKLRQATGVAKAPYVADFIRLLVEGSDEPVLVYAWHRAVYDILISKLKNLNPLMYTGSESSKQKQDAFDGFLKGYSKVLIMSLRAGQGVDGIQNRCRTVVFAELDWSPGVMEQNVGRVQRDGQKDPVQAIFLVSEKGSDPIIAETLGIKQSQVEGIRNPERKSIENLQSDKGLLKKLAQQYLDRAERRKKASTV